MKFCKDCQHHLTAYADPEKARCTQNFIHISYVTGTKTPDFCSNMRISNGKCGVMGKLFQPKSGD